MTAEISDIQRYVAQPGEEAFAELFRVWAPRLIVYFRARGCGLAEAEDLTQEVMLAMFRKSSTLRDVGLFRPWLFRIAKNELLQQVRRSCRRPETNALPTDSVGQDWNPLWGIRLSEWLRALKADDRELILLRYVDGFAYHEIAELLEQPIGTVQWRIHQLRKGLERP